MPSLKLSSKYMLACAVVFIIAPIFLSTLSSDNITATDWTYRHLTMIQQYLRGDFSPLEYYVPLFQWLLLPFVAIGAPMKWFQVIFAALATIGILYYVSKRESEETVLYTAILLASSIAFVEFAGSLMPQALDFALFPLSILFYYQKRRWPMTGLLLAMFFMHGTGFIFIGILLAHSLITKKWIMFKTLLVLLLITAPIFYYYQFAVTAQIRMLWPWDAASQAQWESSYLTPWWKFFAMSGFLTWALLPYAVWRLYKHRFKLSDSQILYILWIAAFLTLIPFNQGIWRAISYQIVPLSLFVASVISSDAKIQGVSGQVDRHKTPVPELPKKDNEVPAQVPSLRHLCPQRARPGGCE